MGDSPLKACYMFRWSLERISHRRRIEEERRASSLFWLESKKVERIKMEYATHPRQLLQSLKKWTKRSTCLLLFRLYQITVGILDNLSMEIELYVFLPILFPFH